MISSRTLLLLATVCTSSVLTGAFQLVSPPMRTVLGKPAVSPKTFSVSRRLRSQVVYASVPADLPEENEAEIVEAEEEDAFAAASKLTLLQRIKQGFGPQNDGLSFRQRTGKMGMSVFLSYGWVSNMSYTVTVSLAWYIFSKRTGNSPLAPGQWKGFLAVYAGFFVFNNIIRPVRVALAVGVTPYFNKFIDGLQNRFQVNRTVAIGLTVLIANVFGTLAFMSAGVFLAATLAGVPVYSKIVV